MPEMVVKLEGVHSKQENISFNHRNVKHYFIIYELDLC